MFVVITGANRGIGLGLAGRFAAAGHQVHATCRQPQAAADLAGLQARHPFGQITIGQLDVAAAPSVAAWAAALPGQPIDLLINNAGVGEPAGHALEEVDLDLAGAVLATNSVGPLRVAQAVAGRLRRPGARIANISSQMGSIGDNQQGGAYLYRMSKAALNMASRTLALQWQAAGIVVVALHPGWVATRMGGEAAPVSVQESSRGLESVILGLTPAQSGGFFNHQGRPLSW